MHARHQLSITANGNSLNALWLEEQRTQQSWRYATIACLIWVFLTALLWLQGYTLGSFTCLIQTCVMLVLMAYFHNKPSLQHLRRFTHLFLGSSCVVVFLVAVFHPEISAALFFLPLGIMMSNQVLGIKGTIPWLAVNLVAFCVYPWITSELSGPLSTIDLNRIFIGCGIALGTFLSCFQSEDLFHRRTGALVDLSEELQMLATTDSLTGLMNRHMFQNRLESELTRGQAEFALLLIDMNGFKRINDTLGHLVGDETLVEIASRLADAVGFDSAFRLGGDEFCVLLTDLKTPESVNDIAASIQEAICMPYKLGDAEFKLGTSIGTAVYPTHATKPCELLSFADAAMYHAKEFRLGICGYQDDLTDHLNESRAMQDQLSLALEKDEFYLVYQPQTDLKTGQVVGVEALLRWKYEGKTISPAKFVPLLEKTRLIIPVGRWIIREACRQLSEWHESGFDVSVSVNVSAVQFQDSSFVDTVYDSIDEFDVDATKVDFEVTESVFIDNVEEVADRLNQLKKLGSSISIDDFGTGYSSLAYLRQLPIDKLKIDREFVKGIPDDDNGTIASSIVVLAKTLGLSTTAEGVETEQQLNFMKKLHCDVYQGYYHSQPMAADEVAQFFDSIAGKRNVASRLVQTVCSPGT